jgi:pre-rRNA-processing protein IPI3
MQLHETILCSTAASGSSAGPGTITLHDIQTGSSLASFKQTNAAQHCTAIVESRNGQGGFMLSAQPDKSILNVYNFQKVTFIFFSFARLDSIHCVWYTQDQIAMKIVLPEKLTCIAVDTRGDYCAGGTAQGRIHLWEVSPTIPVYFPLNIMSSQVASGILYNSWDAHYRQVTVLRFNHDCAVLLSGSDDSGVSVWSLSRSIWPRSFKNNTGQSN